MRALVRFFLSDVPAVVVVIGGCIAAWVAYTIGRYSAEDFAFIWPFGGYVSAHFIAYSILMSNGEFLYVLPFTRSRVLRARLYATGGILFAVWLPAACAFVAGAHSTYMPHGRGAAIVAVNHAAVTLELMVLAQYVYTLAPARTRAVAWLRIAALIAGGIVLYFLPIMFVDPSTTLVPAAVALAAVPVTIIVQRGALDRAELLPGGDAQAVQAVAETTVAVSDSGSRFIERFPPYWRVVTRSLLLRWQYVYLAAFLCLWSGWIVSPFLPEIAPGVFTVGVSVLSLTARWRGAVDVNTLSGMFSLPVKRKTLFRTVIGPYAVLVVLSVTAATLYTRHDIDEFHLSKERGADIWDAAMRDLNVDAKSTLRDVIRLPGLWEEDAPGDLREAVAGAVARDIGKRYGAAIEASDILARDPVEGWVIDSSRIRQRLVDARGRTAVVTGLTLMAAYLMILLWLILIQSGGSRRRIAKVVSKLLALVILATVAGCVRSLYYDDTFSPSALPRVFEVAHFWPLALGLGAGCVLLWALSEHFFEYYEFARVAQRKV